MKTKNLFFLFFWKKATEKQTNPKPKTSSKENPDFDKIFEEEFLKKVRDSLKLVAKDFVLFRRISFPENMDYINKIVEAANIKAGPKSTLDECVTIDFSEFSLPRGNTSFIIKRIVLYKKKAVVYYDCYNPNTRHANKRNNEEEIKFDCRLI